MRGDRGGRSRWSERAACGGVGVLQRGAGRLLREGLRAFGVLAVREDLGPEARRARELEARAYEARPLSFKWREKLLRAAGSPPEVDPDAVRALRPSIERDEPGWVESVRREWEGSWSVESAADHSGVPLQAAFAILLNLHERGELKVEEN